MITNCSFQVAILRAKVILKYIYGIKYYYTETPIKIVS